ncbi:MAG: hypothetical protein ACQERB_13955 [Promethearchaeati archaeon]
MISQKKFKIIEIEETRIELSDLSLFEIFRDVLDEHAKGTINLLKEDTLLYLLYFVEFHERDIARSFLREAECLMRTQAYIEDFGYKRLAYLLKQMRGQLLCDYFVFGSIFITRDNLMVNDKLYIRQILD